MMPLALLAVVGTHPGGVSMGGGTLRPMDGNRLAAFSRGCFWGMEERYRQIPGVVATAVGYMGGSELHPTYESIHANRTGHLETVLVEYDPHRVAYAKLLDAFEASRPGSRSVVWTYGTLDLRTSQGRFGAKARPAQAFWLAEARHQQYSERNGLDLCPIR